MNKNNRSLPGEKMHGIR